MANQQPAADLAGGKLNTRPDGTPIRVLVVDDEPSLAELLASVLRYEGWDIAVAADGVVGGPDRPRVPARRRRPGRDAARLQRL